MKKIILIVAIIAVAGGSWWIYQKNKDMPTQKPVHKPVAVNEQATELDISSKDPKELKEQQDFVRGVQSKYYVKPETEPAGYEGFCDLPGMTRLTLVTDAMNSERSLNTEEYAFFKAELFNRNHNSTIRNNMSTSLVNARNAGNLHPDPFLHDAYITMLEDTTEVPLWRDFCIQFLGRCWPSSSDPKRIETVLKKYAAGSEQLAGTALVQLSILANNEGVKLDETFNVQLAEKLEDPEIVKPTRLTILGIMGQRKDVAHLPLIRKYARQDKDTSFKRMAIASLGEFGVSPETKDSITDEDRALVKAALTHKNRAVARAAKAAIERIEQN